MNKTGYILIIVLFVIIGGLIYDKLNSSDNHKEEIKRLENLEAKNLELIDSLNSSNKNLTESVEHYLCLSDSLAILHKQDEKTIKTLKRRLNEVNDHNYRNISDSLLLDIFRGANIGTD